MAGKDLQYWTTYPNHFLVATNPEVDDAVVLGIIALKQISPDAIQLNRLSVSENARGLGIGRSLTKGIKLNIDAFIQWYNNIFHYRCFGKK